MNYNHVSKKLIINTSGSAGSGGRDGRDGSSGGYYHGNDGSDGENGGDGTHARDININLHADDQAGAVVVQNKNEVCALPLGDAEVAIITKASGGNGGNGGGGGDGARGIDGYSGTDATMYSSGTNGGNGTNGGDGGDGGNGGNGGNGADVTIAVKHTDTDLLMLFAEPEMAGGAAGRGGRRGDGGRGGAGGRGGSGFSWSEPVYHTHVDHDGCSHTDVSYIYHSLPGGSNGCYGASGSDGQNGRDGVRGKDGKLTINVDDGHSYQGFYNLSLRSINQVQSDDGIIEPGETLAVSGVTFANTGLMPTPEHQTIQVSLSPNKWVRFHPRDTATLPGSISEGSSRTVTEAVKFSLNPSSAPHVIDTTFHETGNLQFHARMARVNKEFDRIPQQTYSIDIRYPVEISTVAIPPVIARGEEAPFIVKIRNVSTKPIGISADDSRLLEVKLSAANDNNSILQLIDAETSQAESLVTPAIHTVNLLGAGETAYFTGAIKFSQSTPAYTNAKLNYKLYLGALENPTQKQHVIQQRNIQLQLAERYVHDENADMVLVTNNHTKPETVAQWIEKAKMMGTTINVWNTSLYSGLSYTQKRKDQQNFISQMQGKVIIILNNEMNIENKNTYSTDCLDAMEILEAAKNSNVSTYVVGGHYNLKNAITPLMRNSNDAVYTINEKYFFWRRPKHEDLLKQAAEINKRLQKDHPEQRFVPVVNFAPERITKGKYYLRPTWELGTVETRETLGQSQAHIALRQAGADEFLANHADIFNVLKLMPFARKLQYLDAAVQRSDDAAAKIISVAILSDLTDELMTYAKDKWNGGFSKAKLASALVNLKMMSEHAFVPSQHLNMILTNYDYIAKRLPTNYDKFLFPFWCRRIRIRNVSHQTIEAMMHHYFPANQFNFYNQNLENLYNKLPREELFERYASPYKNDVTFDNHVNVSEPVLEAALPAYQKKNSYFSERFNLFASSSDRNKFIETQKSNCKFEL